MTEIAGSVKQADTWLQRLWRKRWARWVTVLAVLPTLVLLGLGLYLAGLLPRQGVLKKGTADRFLSAVLMP